MTRRKLRRALGLVLLAGLLTAAPAGAQAFEPKTDSERALFEMLKQQQDEIRALRKEVEELKASPASRKVSASKGAAANPPPGAAPSTTAGNTERIDALEQRVDEESKVLQSRVSQVESRTDGGKVTFNNGPAPRWESSSGDFWLQPVGTIQADAAGFEQSDRGPSSPKLHGGTNMRRLHFGLQGAAFRDFSWALVYDFSSAGNTSSGVRDALVSYNGLRPFSLTLGQQKPNVGLEPNFSDRSNASTFMEPGLVANLVTYNGTRNIGAKLSAGAEHWSGSLGIFGDDASNGGVSSALSEGWGPAGRVTFAPINEPGELLHLGASGFWRKNGRATGGSATNPNFQIRYRAQPENTVDPTRLVDTGVMTFGESVGLIAAESAGVYGPLSVQGEWAMSRVDQTNARGTLQFDGGYALASWLLTGESRVYDGRTGVFTRLAPKRNFSLKNGGWGAFELAARWSYIDLNSNPNDWIDSSTLAGVRGGSQQDITVGINWYLNAYLRLMFDYIHADADNFTTPAAEGPGASEGSDADVFALRAHQEW